MGSSIEWIPKEDKLWGPGCHTCSVSQNNGLLPTAGLRLIETEMSTKASRRYSVHLSAFALKQYRASCYLVRCLEFVTFMETLSDLGLFTFGVPF